MTKIKDEPGVWQPRPRRVIEAMHLPEAVVVSPPKGFAAAFSSDGMKLRATFDRLAALGIDQPPAAVEMFDRALTLRADARAAARADDRTAHFVDVAEGGARRVLTTGEVRHHELIHAAERAYDRAVEAFRGAAPTVIDALRAALAEVIERQASVAADGLIDPALEPRYTEIHDIAASIRWATGRIERLGGSHWWRFARPEAVHDWMLTEAERRLTSRPRWQGQAPSIRVRSQALRLDGVVVQMISVHGVKPTLAEAAGHAEDWAPTIIVAEQVIANIERIAADLGVADLVPRDLAKAVRSSATLSEFGTF